MSILNKVDGMDLVDKVDNNLTHLTQTEVWTIVANRGSDQKWEAPREAKGRLGL